MKSLITFLFALSFAGSAFAQEQYSFKCWLIDNPTNYIVVKANVEEFDSLDNIVNDVDAEITMYANDVQVKYVAGGFMIGERLPVQEIDGAKYWAFSGEMGRSGEVAMGYDAVNGSWTLHSTAMELNVEGRAGNAECSVETVAAE